MRYLDVWTMTMDGWAMITAGQLRAARALLGIDQRQLAALAGLSVPTIQRMEASDGVIRGNVDSLMKLIAALDAAGIELIGEGGVSPGGGRGVRLKTPAVAGDRQADPATLRHRVRAGARWRWSCCCGVSRAARDGAGGRRDRTAPRCWRRRLRRVPRLVPGGLRPPPSGSFSPAAPRP